MQVKKSKEELQAEKELVEWMRSFGTVANFKRHQTALYDGIRRNFYDLFDKAFPDRQAEKKIAARKVRLMEIAKNGNSKPKRGTPLYHSVYLFTCPKNALFDKQFADEIKKLRPDWFENYIEKRKRESFIKMMRLMPPFVKFKDGQGWRGVTYKYIFICEKFGEFQATPANIRSSWKNGNSGHPKNIEYSRYTKVKNINTGEIFNSLKDAARSVNRHYGNISVALRTKTKCGGYYWAYVE